MKREDINIRDPFVLVYDEKYYLYGTRGATCWGEADGFDCYVGTDLEEFDGPFEVFHKPAGFAPHRNYWAPEVYAYNGAFYMFASFWTDGPFLFRDKEEKLRMIWSSFAEGNQYCVALASPEHGEFRDDWKSERELLFAKDGGHGMIFTGIDGKRYLALHSPNESLKERPFFYEVNL